MSSPHPAVAWRPGAPHPLVDGFVALAREIRDALGLATHLRRHAARGH
jgi:hypothetical protein